MNPPQKNSTLVAKIVLLFSLICLVGLFLINGALARSSAQSSGERELEDKIPKHLPIRVKLRKEKEKAFKDLKNEQWLRDFELEVTNTGTKPIYFLSLSITLPEITAPDGLNIGFVLHYGRGELGRIEPKAGPNDIPIKPGETYVLSFPDIQITSWERFKQREKKSDPKKLTLTFQILSFGDGTGFAGSNGTALPRSLNEKSGLDQCGPPSNLNDADMNARRHAEPPRRPFELSVDDSPAIFLLANFLSTELSKKPPPIPKAQSGLCCSGTGCFRSKPYVRDCCCDEAGRICRGGTPWPPLDSVSADPGVPIAIATCVRICQAVFFGRCAL